MDSNGQSFLFTGSTLSARLYRKNDEAGKTINIGGTDFVKQ